MYVLKFRGNGFIKNKKFCLQNFILPWVLGPLGPWVLLIIQIKNTQKITRLRLESFPPVAQMYSYMPCAQYNTCAQKQDISAVYRKEQTSGHRQCCTCYGETAKGRIHILHRMFTSEIAYPVQLIHYHQHKCCEQEKRTRREPAYVKVIKNKHNRTHRYLARAL